MKFKVIGNVNEIQPVVQKFCDMATVEWKKQLPMAKKKLDKLGVIGIKKVDLPLDDEMPFLCYVEDGNVILNIPVYIPLKKIFFMPKRQAQKNLEGFMKANGIECKIEYIGD